MLDFGTFPKKHLALLSRRRLEERFLKARGRTLLEEVVTVRLAKSEHLLRETDDKIENIWTSYGFGSAQRVFHLFKAKHGVTPNAWRKNQRL
jgi:transcriptional regulator GlxA family with amidase domain